MRTSARWRLAAGATAALMGATLGSACQEVGAPDRSSGPVRFQLRLQNVLSGETLDISPHYRRTDQSVVQLAPRQVALETGTGQTIPVEIDISRCLADASREGTGTSCPLRVALVLRNALAEVLDSVLIGPLDVVAGASITPPAVTLRHPDTIVLTATADSVLVGGTLAVSAQVLDRVSVPLTDRRLPWSTDNPAIASVSPSGVVTALSPGAFTVTVILEGRPTGPAGILALTARGGGPVVIGPAGGTVYSRTGEAILVIPAGALTTPTSIQIQPDDALPVRTRAVPGTTFRFTPDGLTFTQPASLTLRYATASIPAGAANEPALRMFLATPDSARRVRGSTLNTTAHSVTAPIDHFRSYAVMIATVGVRSLTMSDDHFCSVLASGTALCFGTNSFGELGDGTTMGALATVVSGGHVFSTVSAGLSYNCGLTTAGQVYCWGRNDRGQLGIGSTSNALVPQLVPLPAAAQALSAGYNSACAMDQTQAVYCWGSNTRGQLGVATVTTCGGTPCSTTPLALPLPPTGGDAVMSSGLQHRCVMSATSAGCWGWNPHGQLGLTPNSPPWSLTPVPPPAGASGPFTRLYAGAASSCGLLANGSAYCWGRNFFGEIGGGSTANFTSIVPGLVVGGLQFAMLGAPRANAVLGVACGVTLTGDGYCWGANHRGGLGTTAALATCTFGTFPPFGCTGTPVPVAGGLKFREIHTGLHAACGLTQSDEVWCWGGNPFGPDAFTPVQVQ